MNGASLAYWQLVYNAANERIRAINHLRSFSRISLYPVPIEGSCTCLLPYSGWADSTVSLPSLPNTYLDPTNPVRVITPADSDWPYYFDPEVTGEVVRHGPVLITESALPSTNPYNPQIHIREYYPSYSIRHSPSIEISPQRGTPIANMGPYLEARLDAAHKMHKLATDILASSDGSVQYMSRISWDLVTGEVYDHVLDEVLSGVTFANYSECYAYAYTHLHESPLNLYNPFDANISVNHNDWSGNETIDIYIRFCVLHISAPGSVTADMTIYYETEGDNLGIPVTSSERVKSYSSAQFTGLTLGDYATFGFPSSAFANAPPLPALGSSYSVREDLYPLFILWDFAPYFQY